VSAASTCSTKQCNGILETPQTRLKRPKFGNGYEAPGF
jgi:hypothetical protein